MIVSVTDRNASLARKRTLRVQQQQEPHIDDTLGGEVAHRRTLALTDVGTSVGATPPEAGVIVLFAMTTTTEDAAIAARTAMVNMDGSAFISNLQAELVASGSAVPVDLELIEISFVDDIVPVYRPPENAPGCTENCNHTVYRTVVGILAALLVLAGLKIAGCFCSGSGGKRRGGKYDEVASPERKPDDSHAADLLVQQAAQLEIDKQIMSRQQLEIQQLEIQQLQHAEQETEKEPLTEHGHADSVAVADFVASLSPSSDRVGGLVAEIDQPAPPSTAQGPATLAPLSEAQLTSTLRQITHHAPAVDTVGEQEEPELRYHQVLFKGTHFADQ
jgi:hypothetical protein